MNNSFNELGISPPILKALEEMGFETPTEVQSKAIPHILNHEDLIVISKTGSGKTAVFGVSILQLTDPGSSGPQGLILTPTRELAVQVDSDLKQMSRHLSHKTTAVYGQHNMNAEIRALNQGVSIVTGTPGRVFDHIRHGNLSTKNIRFLVLDEADRMLDMGFMDQVERIIRTVPKDRATLLFSATIPVEIRQICQEYMKHPFTIEIESPTKTVDTIEQVYYRVQKNEKRLWLNRLLLMEQPESCMIFCNTRIAVDQVQSFLAKKGYASQALHGDIPQGKRLKTIQQFKEGEFHLLVATDVAARGIHIDNLALVINYDVPEDRDSYVHRIGRTGRAGNAGRSVTMVTSDDIMSLYAIEEHIGAMISEGELPTEEDFNRRRAEAEKWLQSKAPKEKPPQAAVPERSPREAPRKHTQSKPAQPGDRQRTGQQSGQHNKQRTGPGQANTGQRAPRHTGQGHSSGRTHPAGQARPATAARPAATCPAVSNTAQAKAHTETPKAQEPAARKPFLQRILQRLFGK